MSSRNGDVPPQLQEGETLGLDPGTTIVVSTGVGERFHRPNGLGYDTACKTGFNHPIRETTVAEAVQEGFTPCRKPPCFGRREK